MAKNVSNSSLEHNKQLSPFNRTKVVDICGIEVNVDNWFQSEGILNDPLLATC